MKKKSYFLLFIFIFFLLACVKGSIQKDTSEFQILKNKIDEYWNYIIKGEVEKAYNLEHPLYREKISLLKYINRFKVVKYEGFEIMDINIGKSEANVELEVTQRYIVKHFMDKNFKKKLIDRWAKWGKIWYHLPEGFDLKK